MSELYNPTTNSALAMTGKDGILCTDDGQQVLCIESWQSQANFTNAKFQPCGAYRESEIPQSYGVTLTLSEYVINDVVLLEQLFEAMSRRELPNFNFQGKLVRPDGSTEIITYRNVVPSGTIDLQNVTNGDTIKRQWSFFVNSDPKLQSKLS